MDTTINKVPSFDGYKLNVKIDSYKSALIDKVVIFIHGSGSNTYDNHRKIGDTKFNFLIYLLKNLLREILHFADGIHKVVHLEKNIETTFLLYPIRILNV